MIETRQFAFGRRFTQICLGAAPLLIHLLLGDMTPLERLLGGLPATATLLATERYLRRRPFVRLPFLEYALFQVYVFWGFPTLYADASSFIPADVASKTLFAVNLLLAAIVVAFPAGARLGRFVRPNVDRLLPRGEIALGFFVWPLLALFAWMNTGAQLLPDALRVFETAGATSVPLQVYAAYRGARRVDRRWLLPVVTATAAVAGLASGMLENAVRPLLCHVVIRLLFTSRVPWRPIVAGLVLAIVLTPAKHVYRESAWFGAAGDESPNVVELAGLWRDAIGDAWRGDARFAAGMDSLASRLNELPHIAYTVRQTPESVPYDYFRTWASAFAAPIPRALWPDKPNYKALFNDRYGVTFGFQNWDTTATSTLNLPLVAEGYWNLGLGGVVLVGLLCGLVQGLLSGTTGTHSWASMTVGIAFFSAIHANANLFAQVGGLLHILVTVAVGCWLMWTLAAATGAVAEDAMESP